MLVNNAAVAIRKPTEELTAEDIDNVLAVNVRGVLLLTVACLPPMLAAGSGTVVSITSLSGRRGTPCRGVYGPSKAAIDGMTRSLAMEFGPRGIRFNAVAPGVVHTEMWRRELALDGVEESVMGVIPARRLTRRRRDRQRRHVPRIGRGERDHRRDDLGRRGHVRHHQPLSDGVAVAAMALTTATNTPRRLSADAARRIALAAQGFAQPRPSGNIDRRHLRRVFDRIGLVQIDSVNVLVRSHELPLFSRLGPYPRNLIPQAVADGELFEYWAHMASIVPTEHYPLWRWKMERHRDGSPYWGFAKQKAAVVDNVLAQVRARGPLTVGEIEGRVRNKGTWWDWDESKQALEVLFVSGVVTATRRPNDFARRYDLIERVLPAHVLARPALDEAGARRRLLLMAARSLGVGTLADLADYYRLKATTCKPIVAELAAAGELVPVEVDGWAKPAVPPPRRRDAAPRRGPGSAQPVRLARVVP